MRNVPHPKARFENLVIQMIADETLVYDLANHRAHCLNETAAFVWGRCTGEEFPVCGNFCGGAGECIPNP